MKQKLNRSIFKFIFILSFLSYYQKAHASACCGAGFAIPSIITTEDKAQFATSYSYSEIDTDVDTKNQWQKRRDHDSTEIVKIEVAHLISDLWQVGISIPYQKRKADNIIQNSSSGLSDISVQLGYEYLPDWDYNPYRPKGVGYLSIITPTGKSIYESENGSGIDTRGRGFWGIGLGTVLIKKWDQWDANANIEVKYLKSQKFDNNTTVGRAKPGAGTSASLGMGWNWDNLRLGGLIQWVYQAANSFEGATSTNGNLVRYATGNIVISYSLPSNQSLTLSYGNQTWFGSPYNTSLSESITIFYQIRWER